jgi:hypothetical protein
MERILVHRLAEQAVPSGPQGPEGTGVWRGLLGREFLGGDVNPKER